MDEARQKRIHSVLFVCAMNSVRSPMAEAIARHYFGKSIYVQSAGVRKSDTDGFMASILAEITSFGRLNLATSQSFVYWRMKARHSGAAAVREVAGLDDCG